MSNTLKSVLKLLKKRIGLLILTLLLSVVTVLLTLYIPVLVGNAIDCIVDKGNVDFDSLIVIIIKIAVSVFITALAQWIMSILNNKITYDVIHDMRNSAFEKIQNLPLKFFDEHPVGDTLSRVVSDVDTFTDGLLMGFTGLFTGVFTVLGTVILMFRLNWKIAIIVVVLTPVSLLVAKFIADKTYRMFRLQSETKGEQTAFIEETVGNQKSILNLLASNECLDKFDEINKRLEKYSLSATFFSSMVNPSTRIINAIIYAIVALVGALNVISNPLFTVGTLSALLSFASQYSKPFNEISGIITELQNALASADRVFELVNEQPQVSDLGNTELGVVSGTVGLNNVEFSYTPKKPLIKGLNLDVKKGQKIAIVGPTGCGKTTLINLLMRFYDVTGGSVTIDNIDIREVTRKSLRQNYGMVLQETWLKSGTVKENICMAKPTATDEEIIAAAKATHAHSFIKRLPLGYDTPIGEDGGNLSEGQKQLLCITRIMLCPPPMLILDEATSSIDVRTEHHIQSSFKKLMNGRTSFVVAHRLSTIKESDVILVMKDGNIIEQGNHQELLDKKGFYYELYNSQFAES